MTKKVKLELKAWGKYYDVAQKYEQDRDTTDEAIQHGEQATTYNSAALV